MSTRPRHSRRTRSRSKSAAAPAAHETADAGRLAPVKRVLTSVKGAVITAGALAVAISAIIALVPKGSSPPSTFAASFVPPIQVYENTTLDEYAARVRDSTTASVTPLGGGHAPSYRLSSVTTLGGAHLPGYRLAADTTPVVTTSSSTESSGSLGATSSSSSLESTTDTTTTTETATSSTGSSTSSCPQISGSPGASASSTTSDTCTSPSLNFGASRAGAGLHLLGSAPDVQNVAQQIPLLQRCPVGTHGSGDTCLPDSAVTCPPSGCVAVQPDTYVTGHDCTADVSAGRCGMGPLITRALSGGVEPAAAAQKVVSLFAASRGERTGHTVRPLGVMVTFEADLVGFAGAPATIRWSLFSANPAQHLDPEWYRTIPILSVTPHTNDDRFSSQFWVPEPRRRGDYFVRLEVDSADGLPRTYSNSPVFH